MVAGYEVDVHMSKGEVYCGEGGFGGNALPPIVGMEDVA